MPLSPIRSLVSSECNGRPMTYTTIETIAQGGVAWIWLNRPDVRNAMNDVMIRELYIAVADAIDDNTIRAIVLAGRGKAFCAGGDISAMRRRTTRA